MKQEKKTCHNRVSKYINRSNYVKISDELSNAGVLKGERYEVKDIIFRGSSEKHKDFTGILSEKYIVRVPQDDKDNMLLIKECSKGSKIKEIIEPISYETALRIIERSTKWLCSSLSPLIRELGVKMTTDRLVPDTVMKFERESFTLGNKLHITADSNIALSEYNSADVLYAGDFDSEPVDNNICLLQINYERIIPDYISSIIGIKAMS